jgi:hypothetical protein
LHQTMNFHLLNYKQRSFEKNKQRKFSLFCSSMWLPLSIQGKFAIGYCYVLVFAETLR